MTGRRPLVVGWLLVLAGAAVLAFVLIDRTNDASSGRAATPSGSTGSTRTAVAAPLSDFDEIAVQVTDASGKEQKRCLLAARTDRERARGLMEVKDPTLDGHDGMVFLFEEPKRTGFWMRNTPMPLSIAYFDQAGRVVSTADMTPCRDSPSCPSYPPAGVYTSAIEVPRGRLGALGISSRSRLRLAGRCEADSG